MSAAHPVYMLDADAFLALRSLSLLTRVLATEALPRPVVLTEFIARHELSSIWNEIQIHVDAAIVRIESVEARSSEFRRLRSEGADKGEAEAIAWALTRDVGMRPMFVSLDRRARIFASKNRVPTGDVLDFMVDLVERRIVTKADAAAHAAPWDLRPQQVGKPADFTSFEESFERRRAARSARR